MTDQPDPAHADRSNWRTVPFNRWAFHHVPDILPTARIAAGDARVVPRAERSMAGFNLPLEGGSALDFEGFLRITETDGIVILRDGHIVVEAYANGMTADTPHILMSGTKSAIGLLAGILQQRGALAIEATVTDYVPELAGTVYQGVTIRNLLDMRSGVELDAGQAQAYDRAGGWGPVTDAPGLHGFFKGLSGPPARQGGPFRYVSANTDLLGWIMERATGQRVADLLSIHLWRPMGAEHAAWITLDGDGSPRCTGGLGATTRDFARLGHLMLQDGPVVPSAWLTDITGGGDRTAWRDGEWGETYAPLSRSMSYRSGWYVMSEPAPLLFAMGIHGQHLFIDRPNRLVIAKVSSQAIPLDYQAAARTFRAVAEVRRVLADAGS